jgi:hypothetical protein
MGVPQVAFFNIFGWQKRKFEKSIKFDVEDSIVEIISLKVFKSTQK